MPISKVQPIQIEQRAEPVKFEPLMVEPTKVRPKSRPAEIKSLKTIPPVVESPKVEPSVHNSPSPSPEEIPAYSLKVSVIHQMLMDQQRTKLAESQRTPGTPVNQILGMSLPLTKSATTQGMSPAKPQPGPRTQLTVVTKKLNEPKTLYVTQVTKEPLSLLQTFLTDQKIIDRKVEAERLKQEKSNKLLQFRQKLQQSKEADPETTSDSETQPKILPKPVPLPRKPESVSSGQPIKPALKTLTSQLDHQASPLPTSTDLPPPSTPDHD